MSQKAENSCDITLINNVINEEKKTHQANPKQSGLGELCAQVLIDKKNQRRQKHAIKSVELTFGHLRYLLSQ